MSINSDSIVLDHERIALIIERFAHEIYELHHKQTKLVLVGIEGRGHTVAKRIMTHLKAISKQELALEMISLDKLSPTQHEISLSTTLDTLEGQTIILVDDVLNSGRTLVHALRHILSVPVTHVTTVVLVDRIHRNFPVRADLVGLSLSTTIQSRVEVELGKRDYAYLI